MNDGLTARGKDVTSRAQAWFALRAAVLELEQHLGKKPPPTNKAFWSKFNRYKLWLVAKDTRPNRREVLLESLRTGKEEWICIGDWDRLPLRNYVVWHEYRVLETYPDQKQQQNLLFEERLKEHRSVTNPPSIDVHYEQCLQKIREILGYDF